MGEICASGSVGGEGGNILAYPAAPVGRRRNLAREGVGGGGAIDDPPWHHDLLVGRACPFEIRYRDLAVNSLLQSVEELRRGESEDVALPLKRLLVRVHGVGDVDGDHELHVDISSRSGRAAHLGYGL